MENNSTLEKVLLVCSRKAELLRLVGATFDSKVASLRGLRKKNLIIPKSLQRKVSHFLFYLFAVVLTFELSNIIWKCSENWNMLTERTYDSVVFKIFLNIITISILKSTPNNRFLGNIFMAILFTPQSFFQKSAESTLRKKFLIFRVVGNVWLEIWIVALCLISLLDHGGS